MLQVRPAAAVTQRSAEWLCARLGAVPSYARHFGTAAVALVLVLGVCFRRSGSVNVGGIFHSPRNQWIRTLNFDSESGLQSLAQHANLVSYGLLSS